MGVLKVCTGLVALVAAAIGLFITLGRQNDLAKGIIPALVAEHKISFETIPNLSGKTVVVTGANSGLGKSASKLFALNGAQTVMVCRSESKCNRAKEMILNEMKSEVASSSQRAKISDTIQKNIITMEADLSSLKSVQTFGKKMNERYDKIHSLVLNAGVMQTPFGLTKDGIEQQIGINHFGHFYMTKLLLPLVEKAQPSTIVSVSSVGHYGSYTEGIKLSLESINDESQYESFTAYGQSKLANVLFAQELSDRLQKQGKEVFVNSIHPGAVNTELARDYPQLFLDFTGWLGKTFPNTFFFESDYASLTEIYAAVGEEIFAKGITGKYMVPIGEQVAPAVHAKNMTLQKELWNLTEKVLKDKGFA